MDVWKQAEMNNSAAYIMNGLALTVKGQFLMDYHASSGILTKYILTKYSEPDGSQSDPASHLSCNSINSYLRVIAIELMELISQYT